MGRLSILVGEELPVCPDRRLSCLAHHHQYTSYLTLFGLEPPVVVAPSRVLPQVVDARAHYRDIAQGDERTYGPKIQLLARLSDGRRMIEKDGVFAAITVDAVWEDFQRRLQWEDVNQELRDWAATTFRPLSDRLIVDIIDAVQANDSFDDVTREFMRERFERIIFLDANQPLPHCDLLSRCAQELERKLEQAFDTRTSRRRVESTPISTFRE